MLSRRNRHRLRLAAAVLASALPGWAAPSSTQVESTNKSVGTERLGEDAELVRATSLYDIGQYGACVDAFERLLNPDEPRRVRSPSNVEAARTYHGACLIGVGRTTDAERVFRDAILENPQMRSPDGLLFPEAVVELFLRVRESMLDEIRRAEQKRMQDAEARANSEQQLRVRERMRVDELVAIAQKEVVVEQHHRWIASIPFGVGQFQNGNRGLGWALLLGETAMSGLLVGALYMDAYYRSKSDDPRFEPRELNAGTERAINLQIVGGYGLLGLALIGIAEAHIAFVPEIRTERTRKLPNHLRLPSPKASTPNHSISFVPWTGAGFNAPTVGGALVGAF